MVNDNIVGNGLARSVSDGNNESTPMSISVNLYGQDGQFPFHKRGIGRLTLFGGEF